MSADGVRVAVRDPASAAFARVQPEARRRVLIALLGTGQVGRALLARIATLTADADGGWCSHVAIANRTGPGIVIDAIADSTHCLIAPSAIEPRGAVSSLAAHGRDGAFDPALLPRTSEADIRVIVDATASDEMAARHATWLRAGFHVVTANKLGRGAALARCQDIDAATHAGGTRYGDSATVGAGLPLLRTIRALCDGGDRILEIAGVLSGSLAWLFDRYDGSRAFSAQVQEARALGYTEPDPRIDLSGEDVKRKLLILSRAAGEVARASQVKVESPWPGGVDPFAVPIDDALHALDPVIAQRHASAAARGLRLCHVARYEADAGLRVGLEALPPDHPLAAGGGCDNRVLIRSDRYASQPMLIRGPGAGPEVTAAALLDDILQIAAAAR